MNIQIIGTGITKFGELWDTSPRALAREAITQTLLDAKKKPTQIDALFVSNMLAGIFGNQSNIGSLLCEELGTHIPGFHIEAACASGGLALHTAINSLLAGTYNTVMILGIEKMTDYQETITAGLMAAGSDEERQAGATFPGLYALMAQAYLQQYNITEELLAAVSVKNHYHGSLNPKVQFQKPITITDVMNSPKIADPLKLLDCSPISDGAAAVILTNQKPQPTQQPVYITASEIATDTLALHNRQSFTSLNAVIRASQKAYQKTNITPQQIDVAEIHDCFSIAEIIATEDLGFSPKGQAAKDIAQGKYTLHQGKTITNPSGGLKACGHPVGATGIKQIIEITHQLRGQAGTRQVKNAKTGLTHNVGGSGTIAAIHILQTP